MIGNARRVALGIISGKIILNFGVQKRLRAFLNPIFTGRVVTANSSCSAAGDEPSPSLLRKATSPERGRFYSTYRQMV